MNKLTAIVGPHPGPGHGECFIWQRSSDAMVVAVDSGGATSVGEEAGGYGPEILILSHDDSDHIQGAVKLIQTGSALKELWIPVEWIILVKQIAETPPDNLLGHSPKDAEPVWLEELEGLIAKQLVTTSQRIDDEQEDLRPFLTHASENLSTWDTAPLEENQGFTFYSELHDERERWHGAKDLKEIIRRVKFRAHALINILSTALNNSVHIRYFSIDVALYRTTKEWEHAGRPGTVTLANASEVPCPPANHIPPGLAFAYALTRLTIQNRRALCTLLWNDPSTLAGGFIIWSDTEGQWLTHSTSLGFGDVIKELKASSAPHHASANIAHDQVWRELRKAPHSLVMISAGGKRNQSYRSDYLALKSNKCCTWCRPTSTTYQEVTVSSSATGFVSLHHTCKLTH